MADLNRWVRIEMEDNRPTIVLQDCGRMSTLQPTTGTPEAPVSLSLDVMWTSQNDYLRLTHRYQGNRNSGVLFSVNRHWRTIGIYSSATQCQLEYTIPEQITFNTNQYYPVVFVDQGNRVEGTIRFGEHLLRIVVGPEDHQATLEDPQGGVVPLNATTYAKVPSAGLPLLPPLAADVGKISIWNRESSARETRNIKVRGVKLSRDHELVFDLDAPGINVWDSWDRRRETDR